MKIIQIMPEFGLAGAEIMCENLIYELRRKGHQVIVISMYNYHSAITDRLEKSGVDIRYLNKKRGFDFSMLPKMRKIFKIEMPDVIHTHRYTSRYVIPAAIFMRTKAIVHTVHSVARYEQAMLGRRLNNVFFKCFKVVPVALSEAIRASVSKEYRLDKCRIPVVYNGINLSNCIPKDNYEIADKFRILNIGRFAEAKNHIGLLKAFKIFHKKYPNSELQLIGDGELMNDIKHYVEENAFEGSVSFLGLQSNVYDFLHNADIFTLPSLYEGIPMTLIEAMGTGLPIVATAVGGVVDMLTDGEDAILTKVDVEETANAFERYYLDSELRKNYGQKAKERSIAFSAEYMAEKYVEIYKNN